MINADSVFSAVATYDFLWRGSGSFGLVTGQNHDPAVRPRRQEREPDFRETGAFYVMAAAGFRAARHRFFGRTAVVQVPELTAVDIDHLHDLALAGALAQVMESPPDIDVDAVITDFDGVHTDDSVTIAQDGRESVRVSRADGLGVERLRSVGIPLLIVSKEINPVVGARAGQAACRGRAGRGGQALRGARLPDSSQHSPCIVLPISATMSMILVQWVWSAGLLRLPMLTRPFARRHDSCWRGQGVMGRSESFASSSSSIASAPRVPRTVQPAKVWPHPGGNHQAKAPAHSPPLGDSRARPLRQLSSCPQLK